MTEGELTDQTLWQAAESLAPGAGGRTAELAVRAVFVGYVADWWAAERVETPRSDGRGANSAWIWDSSRCRVTGCREKGTIWLGSRRAAG
ncbi:hypothetical protein AB0469_29415 [Streptomyces sp. NPDC093801]|uniref:hypothetical protein n=1 Tax=Streptomyces sp. NPDC093801 TaxID=3155203 RepID=UPI00344C0F9C